MQIHFQIEYITRWGENLYLCLNMSDGSVLSLDMANNGAGTWFTDYEIDDDDIAAGDITYCYVVQIDGNIPVLVLFLIAVNVLIGVISYFIYRGSKQTGHSFRTRRKR